MADDDLYDLAPGHEPSPRAASSSQPSASVPLAYQTPAKTASEPDISDDPIVDFYMPLSLLGGGVVIETAAALIQSRGTGMLIRQALLGLGMHLILGTAVMLVGVWIAAKIRGIEFGAFWIAVLKLSAVAVAPGAVIHLLSPALSFIPLGGILGFVFQFILYFALLGALFKMDESDTWYCVCVIFVLNVGLYFAILALKPHF
jgi:hypothetical protein